MDIYWILCIIVTLLNGSVYCGMNRSDFLMSMLSSLTVYIVLVGKHYKKLLAVGLVVTVLIFSIITDNRNYYTDPNGTIFSNTLVTFQAYAGGVYNVAMSIETKNLFPEGRSIGVFIFEIFRPVIGLNMILKLFDARVVSIVNLFNLALFKTPGHVTQIIPMIGEGYYHFGFILSPLLGVAFIYVAVKISRLLENTRNLEVFFFLAIPAIRIGFFMGQNAMIQLNDMSFNIVVPLLIFQFNKLFMVKNNDYHRTSQGLIANNAKQL